MSDAERTWRRKSDDELRKAAEALHEYTEEGRKIIVAELSRRSLDAEVSTTQPEEERAVRGSAPVDRYRDAYRVANATVSIGNAIKFVGLFVAALTVIVAFWEIEGGIAMLGGILFIGLAVALAVWLAGVLIAAQGQLLQSVLDTAVHSSPFLTNDERALAMSLRLANVPSLGAAV